MSPTPPKEPFVLKRNDTSPALVWDVTTPVATFAGATIVFSLRDQKRVLVINRKPASYTELPDELPALIYEWDTGDSATDGKYFGEFEVTFADGKIESFPNSFDIPVSIGPDVA